MMMDCDEKKSQFLTYSIIIINSFYTNNKTYYPQTFFDVYIAIDQYNEIYCQWSNNQKDS